MRLGKMVRGAGQLTGCKDSLQFSGHQGHQKDQPLKVRKLSIYFTNFPDGWYAEHLRKIFEHYGDIVDVFIPDKRNIKGQRYGFIRYAALDDVDGMIASLNQIWIGSYKLRFYRARGFNAKEHSNCHKRCSPKDPLIKISYAEVVKGDGKPKEIFSESGVPESSAANDDKAIPVSKEKSSTNLNVPSSSQCTNHVQVTIDNGVLVIKINLVELLRLNDSDSSLDSAFCSKKDMPHTNPELKLSLFKQTNVDVEEPIMSCNVSTDPLPLDGRKQVSNSDDATKDPIVAQDQGSSNGLDSNEESKLGSPCFSVHSRSTEGINLAGGADFNLEETPNKCISDEEDLQIDGEDIVDVGSRDIEAFEGQISPEPMDPNIEVEKEKEEEIGKDDQCADESEHEEDCLGQFDIGKWRIPKKKKRKNHKWSKKKSHSKVVVCFPTPGITDNDICISDGDIRNRNSLYDEAIKTLDVSKLLGITWENDDIVIQRLIEQERELMSDYDKG